MLTLAAFAFAYAVQVRASSPDGFLDYVQAADLLQGEEANVFASWAPGAKPRPKNPDDPDDKGAAATVVALYKKFEAMSTLDVRREELRRYGRALDLVARGNSKPVFVPHRAGEDAMDFPLQARLKQLTRFTARAATVYAADGQTSRAVDILCNGLTMADNTARGPLISNLVGIANIAIVLAAFNDLLSRLSRADAIRVQGAVSNHMGRPASIRSTPQAELETLFGPLRELLSAKKIPDNFFAAGDGEDDPKSVAMAKEFTKMTPAARQKMLRQIEAKMANRAREFDRVLAGPDAGWHAGMVALEETAGPSTDPYDFAGALLEMLSPVYTQAIDAALRSRTQIRLLALHARLIEYRWEYGKYPISIDETDPLTGEKYLYELRPEGTIRLASKGLPTTGEIELRYKAPPAKSEETKP